jgi:hypothetical protein
MAALLIFFIILNFDKNQKKKIKLIEAVSKLVDSLPLMVARSILKNFICFLLLSYFRISNFILHTIYH